MQLQSCPFCGKDAGVCNDLTVVYDWPHDGNVFWNGAFFVMCKGCHSRGKKYSVVLDDIKGHPNLEQAESISAQAKAIAHWDTRVK